MSVDNKIYGLNIINAIELAGLEDAPIKCINFDEETNTIYLHFQGRTQCRYHHDSNTGKYEKISMITETRLVLTIYKDGTWSLNPLVFNYEESKELLDKIADIKKKNPDIRDKDIARFINPDMSVREYRQAVVKAKRDIYEEERQAALKLRQEGYDLWYIAEKLGCSESMVRVSISKNKSQTVVL